MSWERDPLYAKARLFFQHATESERDDPRFGLWCSLGLELLARAAVASVNPALLAQPDSSQKYLLHVVHKESEVADPKSISASLVFDLCKRMFTDFSDDDASLSSALLNRRNAELHSGEAAFDAYRPNRWLAGFYHACNSLVTVLGESLEDLLGESDARFAEEMLAESHRGVMKQVQDTISAHRKAFEAKPLHEQSEARAAAEQLGQELAARRHHRVVCPACGCTATTQGRLFGKEHVMPDESGNILVKQAVSPTVMSCSACGLRLATHAQLEAAGLGEHYTHRTTYSPEDYYGLVQSESWDESEEDILEYDNE